MTEIRTYCSLCGVGCPTTITLEGPRVVSLQPDRTHPQGGAFCVKGRAAPEIHDHPHRVNYPLRRTRPKGASDPGWERCSWDEALDIVASNLNRVRDESGPQAVAFGRGTGGGTGLKPAEPWVHRLAGAFGTPNYMTNTHLCNWARDGASYYTFGQYPLPLPDSQQSNCILLWGSNPSATQLDIAQGMVAALRRGARLVAVDPRRIGLAKRADLLLQLRPGTDGALALAFIDVLIENNWFDEDFVREWTNAPLLVRDDTQRLLRAEDIAPEVLARGAPVADPQFVGFDAALQKPVEYSPTSGLYAQPVHTLALRGSVVVQLSGGERVRCRPVFDLLAEVAGRCSPDVAAEITGVSEDLIVAAVRLIVENRPVSHHTYNGIVQHTNATQAGRSLEIFYALLGDWDRPGGNVVPMAPRTRDIGGDDVPEELAAIRLGREQRPLGPPSAPPGNIAAYDLYEAICEGKPYQVRALLSFGGNPLLNTGNPLRGREAFEQLEFFAQAELFHTPTNHYADVLLPVADFLESETLVITGGGIAQRRRRAVEPLYERRPDTEIVFAIACRLGLEKSFADGDVSAAFDEVLAPTGLTWDALLDRPHGVRVAPEVRYRKYAETSAGGHRRGFSTPTGKVELFIDAWTAHGQAPVPAYEEPAESPVRTPELARDYPLVLTNSKRAQYLHSQHRGIAAIRRKQPDPTMEIHPDTAARWGIEHRAWVVIETPRGRARARAELTPSIVPGVVCASHGWWEACEELGLDAMDPFDERGANINLLVHNDKRDPISGGIPHRSSLCRVRPVRPDESTPASVV